MIEGKNISNWIEKKASSQRYFDNAEDWLHSGEALNRVPYEISTAIKWAMEAWLLKQGHELDFGHGWNSMTAQFFQLAPQSVKSGLGCLMTSLVFLETDLEGGPLPEETAIVVDLVSLEKWKEKAGRYLTKAKTLVERMDL